jgi:hypothetical protein
MKRVNNITSIKNKSNAFIIGQLTADYDDGATITSIAVTSTQRDLKDGDKFIIQGQEFTVAADAAATATAITIDSVELSKPIQIGNYLEINQNNLFQQYQRKTEGTIGGMPVTTDSMGPITYSGGDYSLTGTLVPNYGMAKCTGTATTSATDGAVNAVVIPFDTLVDSSSPTTIALTGASGVSGVSDTEYAFYMDIASGLGVYELNYQVGINTHIANNRIIAGLQLEVGTITGSSITWSIITPSTSYIYNRGTGSMRYASASNSLLVTIGGSGKITYYRLMIWKENSTNASTTAITLTNATQITMKKL